MGNEVLWPEVATVALVGLQLVVLVVAALYARGQVKEARELREQQNRPFVVIDVDYDRASELFLHVENIGTSLARNVTFQIEPPLKSSIPDIEVAKFKMLKDGIPTLAPGKQLRSFIDLGFKRNEESDLPMVYSATVRYSDETGKRPFEEEMYLDIEQFMHLNFITRRDTHDIHERLKEIRDALGKWKWSGGNGLLTITRREADERNARRLAEIEEERRQRESGSDS